ncbi:hypothetical protein [Pseudooceanicola sp.]|uniref:hypothetical protein n=1 Tax=Pseudooceanicola sp. TaxID=1914328 RepID=UPI0035C7734E
MIRAALCLALAAGLGSALAGPMSAADGGGAEAKTDALADENMQPHPVTLPASYVALPEALVTKIRNKILISRGEEPMKDDDAKDGGGH